MEDFLIWINEDLWGLINNGSYRANVVKAIRITARNESMTATRLKQEANDKRCIRKLRGALPPVIYNYLRGCKTAQEI